jgi:hypothetical protein
MPPGRNVLGALLTAAVGLTLAGCGSADRPSGQSTATGVASPSRATAAPSHGHASATEGPRTSSYTDQEDRMLIRITIGDQRFQATLADSAASRDLVAQLPLTVDMVDHGSVEQTGALPAPLSLDGQPDGADPGVGDVRYYAPGNDFVLYCGDQSYYEGIVILGHLDDDAAAKIADMDGSVTASIETDDD